MNGHSYRAGIDVPSKPELRNFPQNWICATPGLWCFPPGQANACPGLGLPPPEIAPPPDGRWGLLTAQKDSFAGNWFCSLLRVGSERAVLPEQVGKPPVFVKVALRRDFNLYKITVEES